MLDQIVLLLSLITSQGDFIKIAVCGKEERITSDMRMFYREDDVAKQWESILGEDYKDAKVLEIVEINDVVTLT